MSTGQDESLTVASVNFLGAGARAGYSEDRWQAVAGLLRAEAPHVVLCQGMRGGKPDPMFRDLQATARELDMTAVVLGRAPAAVSGQEEYTAILVRDNAGLDVIDTGPADGAPWSEALLLVPGIPYPVRFYSIHLPASSDVRQRHTADALASRVAGLAHVNSEVAFAGVSWNCPAPADSCTQDQLTAMPGRVRPAQIRTLPDGRLEPILDVHQVLDGVGLADVAAVPAGRRYPPELTPAGPGGRTCRAYATRDLAAAAGSYRQVRNDVCGDLLVITINLAAARISLRGPRK